MATADFSAIFVFERAFEREIELEEELKAVREVRIVELMDEDVIEGRLWWQRSRKRTREQAEEHYDFSASCVQSVTWWRERPIKKKIADLMPLQRIAGAVIQANGNEPVTLTPDDCAVLAIPVKIQFPI